MATTITAGNATSGLAFSADNTGAFEFKTGTGAGTTAITVSSAQQVTFAGNVSGVLKFGAAATASGASVDFINIPSTANRITLSAINLSYAAAGAGVLQIGSGSLITTGYTSNTMSMPNTAVNVGTTQTNGFGRLDTAGAAQTLNVTYVLVRVNANTWAYSMQSQRSDLIGLIGNGYLAVGATLDRLSLVATTSTFDSGTVNILWE